MDKLWYIHAGERNSEVKGNELSSQEKTRRKLKRILLSERSQSEKAPCCTIPSVRHSGRDKTRETVKISVAAGGRGEGGMRRRSTEGF